MLKKLKKVSPRRSPSSNVHPPVSIEADAYEHAVDADAPQTAKTASLNKALPRQIPKIQRRSKSRDMNRRSSHMVGKLGKRQQQQGTQPKQTYSKKVTSRMLAKIEELNYLIKGVEDSESIFQPGGGESPDAIMKKTELMEAHSGSIQKEFETLCTMKQASTTAFDNAPPEKNRYLDIPCRDNSRVILRNSPDKNEYIHANYVDNYKHSRAFVCCQGPKEETSEDFWDMVWQEGTFVIAMLTKCIEGNKIKCSEYWPLTLNTTKTFGIYTVHCNNKKIDTNYEYTELILTRSDQTKGRLLVHTLFTAWPDNDIPDDVRKLLGFVDIVRRTQKGFMEKYHVVERTPWTGHPLGPPIVVHCSAGIGRSGTFCAIDICCRKLFDTGRVDILETVRLIRTQRTRAVQKIEQYLFVYSSIIDFAKAIGLIVE